MKNTRTAQPGPFSSSGFRSAGPRPGSPVKPYLVSFTLIVFAISLLSLLPSPTLKAAEEAAQTDFFHALKSKQEGNLLRAERLFRKAIEIEPENADYHFELGNLYIERKNLPAAKIELEQAVMIASGHLAAHYNLGLVYRELAMMSEARDRFRRVLELDPNHMKAQLQIGYTYQAEGFVEDARQAFDAAREMDVTNSEPEQAMEDLAMYEARVRQRERNSLNQSILQNQELLQLLSRRSQTQSQDENETRSS